MTDRIEKSTDELYGDGGRYAAEAYVAGAHAYRTLTDTEWEAMREDVAQAIWSHALWAVVPRLPWPEWAKDNPEYRSHFHAMADAAMRAMGFRRKGQL